MNKPKNCVTTVSDPQGRPTVMDLLRGVKARVYPVGRLDYASEGLLLLTNDGEFAKRITSAASHVHQDLPGEDQRPAHAPSRKRNSAKACRSSGKTHRARRPEADPRAENPGTKYA